MKYYIQMFPDQKTVIPQIGDTFVVKDIKIATDFHWGKYLDIMLEPVDKVKDSLEKSLVVNSEIWKKLSNE